MAYLVQQEEVAALSPARLVAIYLMASYAYYHCNDAFMTDPAYDALCRRLDLEWNLVNHPHKYTVRRSALRQTTGYRIPEQAYPTVVKVATAHALRLSGIGNPWLPRGYKPAVLARRRPAIQARPAMPAAPQVPSVALVLRRRPKP